MAGTETAAAPFEATLKAGAVTVPNPSQVKEIPDPEIRATAAPPTSVRLKEKLPVTWNGVPVKRSGPPEMDMASVPRPRLSRDPETVTSRLVPGRRTRPPERLTRAVDPRLRRVKVPLSSSCPKASSSMSRTRSMSPVEVNVPLTAMPALDPDAVASQAGTVDGAVDGDRDHSGPRGRHQLAGQPEPAEIQP